MSHIWALSSHPQCSSWSSAGLHCRLTLASCHHFIAVLVASRESWRLCRAMDKSKIHSWSILRCCTTGVEPTADLSENDTTNICFPSGTEDFSFPSRLQFRIMHVLLIVMCPLSTVGVHNRNTYVNVSRLKLRANANAPMLSMLVGLPWRSRPHRRYYR